MLILLVLLLSTFNFRNDNARSVLVNSFALVPPTAIRSISNECHLGSKHQRFFLPTPSTEDNDSATATTTEVLPTAPATELLRESIQQHSNPDSIWENLASNFISVEEDPALMKDFVQLVTVLRVGLPSLGMSTLANVLYPSAALWLASVIDDSGAFAVISQDSSQFIQNILTTSGLVFSLLVGQTYYFMYQQQERIYVALYEEVALAKSLLEQIGLVSQGRKSLHQRILQCMKTYVQDDLQRLNIEPAVMISARPVDDPLEDVLYLTSVGEPSIVYQTVRSLRQARACRLGALQKKLPSIHMTLLWSLAVIVLCSFPLLGAGAQTIGGLGILKVQSWYLSFIVFGICLTMGVVYELQRPGESGAYNARTVLQVMVAGLEEELIARLRGKFVANASGPTLDINREPTPHDRRDLASNTLEPAALLPAAEEIIIQSSSSRPMSSSSPSTDPPFSNDVELCTSTPKPNNDGVRGNENRGKKEKRLKKKLKNWAFDLLHGSVTKYK